MYKAGSCPAISLVGIAFVLAGLTLIGCAVAPPKPSVWELENQCATTSALADLEDCTRRAFDEVYGPGWHKLPQANVLIDSIAANAEKVRKGELSEADGRQAIATFASRQADYQAERAAQRAAALQEMAQIGIALMAQQPQQSQVSAKFMVFGGPGHQTYLGCLSCGPYATDSVLNENGPNGSPYSLTSVRNQVSQFGSPYSLYSACSPYASDPPVIVDQAGNFYGRLTVNALNAERARDATVLQWLDGVCGH